MRPSVIDVDVADATLTGFLSNATGATWTLTTTATSDGLAHQVSVKGDNATNHSAKTAVLTGTDANGNPQTETINLPNGTGTVESTKYFKTLTSVVPSATIGTDTMDIGWVDEVAAHIYPLDRLSPFAANIHVDVTGTIDYTVQETFGDIFGDPQNVIWTAITAFSAKTTDVTGAASVGATAIRVIVNSYSSGAELQVYTNQATDY